VEGPVTGSRRRPPGHTARGYLAIVGAALFWAAGATVARTLMDSGLSPTLLAAARAWMALGFLSLVWLPLRRLSPRASWRSAGLAAPLRENLLLTGLFGGTMALANLTYYAAVARLPVAVAITLQYTSPALVLIWTSLERRRPPGKTLAGALLLVLAGVPLLSGLPGLARGVPALDTAGLAMAGLASLSFACYMVVADRVTPRLGPLRAIFGGFAVAALLWATLFLARGLARGLGGPAVLSAAAPAASPVPPLPSAGKALRLLFVGSFGTVVPFFLFVYGLSQGLGAARAGIVSTLEPLSAAVLAYIFLGQSLGGWQMAGGLLVLTGVTLARLAEDGT
jgi:drug/metabolite transporter (DMT)-like permease